MPMDLSKYPSDWQAISMARRKAAGWKCQQCGLKNGWLIIRNPEDGSEWVRYDLNADCHYGPDGSPIRMSELPEWTVNIEKFTKVVLSVHHAGVPYPDGTPGDPRDKHDCREENLQVLCQRCHFLADLPHHIVEAKKSRARKRRKRIQDAGQADFLVQFDGGQ